MPAAERETVLSQLAILAGHDREGWDGLGSAPVNPAAVSQARAFLLAVSDDGLLPWPLATVDGGILLAWGRFSGRYADVYFGGGPEAFVRRLCRLQLGSDVDYRDVDAADFGTILGEARWVADDPAGEGD